MFTSNSDKRSVLREKASKCGLRTSRKKSQSVCTFLSRFFAAATTTNMTKGYDHDSQKQRYTKQEAIDRAAVIRSGHGGGTPESRVDAYYDPYGKCWRIGKVKKRFANYPRES